MCVCKCVWTICFTVGVFICVFTFNSRLCFSWDKTPLWLGNRSRMKKKRQQIYLFKCKVFVEHVWRALFFFFFFGWWLNVLVRGFCGCICLLFYYNNFIWCSFFYFYFFVRFCRCCSHYCDLINHFISHIINSIGWSCCCCFFFSFNDERFISFHTYIIIVNFFLNSELYQSPHYSVCTHRQNRKIYINVLNWETVCVCMFSFFFNYLNVSLFLILRICSAIGTLVDYI